MKLFRKDTRLVTYTMGTRFLDKLLDFAVNIRVIRADDGWKIKNADGTTHTEIWIAEGPHLIVKLLSWITEYRGKNRVKRYF